MLQTPLTPHLGFPNIVSAVNGFSGSVRLRLVSSTPQLSGELYGFGRLLIIIIQ